MAVLKIMNILFVCSRNQWRSPTAEAIFNKSQLHTARSAGTSDSARVKISQKLVDWADIIFVMERRHKEIIAARFNTNKKIIVLDIPDEYGYMDDELVAMIKSSVTPHLGDPF